MSWICFDPTMQENLEELKHNRFDSWGIKVDVGIKLRDLFNWLSRNWEEHLTFQFRNDALRRCRQHAYLLQKAGRPNLFVFASKPNKKHIYPGTMHRRLAFRLGKTKDTPKPTPTHQTEARSSNLSTAPTLLDGAIHASVLVRSVNLASRSCRVLQRIILKSSSLLHVYIWSGHQ